MAVLTPALSQAANGSWNVDAAGNWISSANWLNGIIPGSTTTDNSDVATFSFTLTAARTVTVDTGRYIGGITFGNSSTLGYTLSGGSLNLNNGGVIQNLSGTGGHTDQVQPAIRISGDNGTATFSANATSTSSLLSIGAVTGSSTAGNTTVLTLNGSNTSGNSVGVIGNGASGGNLALVKDGTGTWGIGSTGTYTGGTFIKAGRLTIGADNILPSTTTVTLGSASAAGTFSLGGGSTGRSQTVGGLLTTGLGGSVVGVSTTLLATLTVNNASGNNLFDGKLGSGTTGASNANGLNLIKNGAGTLTLSGANTYTGTTTLSTGTLVFGRTTARSTSTTVTAAANTVVGLGVGGTGYYSETDVSNLFANALTGFSLNTATGVGIDTTAGNFTYSVTQGGARSLTKLGANSLTLTGANTYSGGTLVSAGTLIGTSTSLQGAINNNSAVIFDQAANGSYGGSMSGTGTLTKINSGTLTLTGSSSYSAGTTVSTGTLLVNNSTGSATGTGAVTVVAGSTLGGSGAIAGATTISGILAPGNSIGTLTVANDVIWNGSSLLGGDATTNWKFELGAANTADLLRITGAASEFIKGSGSVFCFDFMGSTETGTFTLVDWDSIASVGGGVAGTNFNVADFSYTNLGSSNTGTFQFNGSQLEFQATAVPEPSTTALSLLSAVLFGTHLAIRRRRRV